MARAPAMTQSLVDRRYAHDMAEWAAWQQHQARLRRLAARALDALEETLDAGGPDALKAAALILRTAGSASAPTPPQRYVLEMTDGAELAAGILTPPEQEATSAP